MKAKRFWSAILALTMALCLLPVSAKAAEPDVPFTRDSTSFLQVNLTVSSVAPAPCS